MNKSVRNSIFLLIVALFVGGYIYLRHGREIHHVMVGGGGQKGHASQEYITYFGQVPDVPVGECDGIVIFYPSKDGKSLVPYPFFITTREKRGALIARTILSGLPVPSMNDYLRPPVPGGGELGNIEVVGNTATLEVLLRESITERDLAIFARSFLMAYSQVDPEVARVIVAAGGGLRVEDDIRTSPPGRITVKEPGRPVLLDAFLVAKKEGEDPREVRIFFDRPVAITSFRVEGPGGAKIPGKLYLSEFSMAGIFRTEGPLGIDAGESFSIIYNAHDFRGRHAEGKIPFIARIKRLAEELR